MDQSWRTLCIVEFFEASRFTRIMCIDVAYLHLLCLDAVQQSPIRNHHVCSLLFCVIVLPTDFGRRKIRPSRGSILHGLFPQHVSISNVFWSHIQMEACVVSRGMAASVDSDGKVEWLGLLWLFALLLIVFFLFSFGI